MIIACYVSKNTPKEKLDVYMTELKLLASTSSRLGYTFFWLEGTADKNFFMEVVSLARDFLRETIGPVFLLDCDCVILEPIDLDLNFDVGVMYRYKWQVGNARHDVLGGNLLFTGRDRAKEIQFLTDWFQRSHQILQDDDWFSTQNALNELVGEAPHPRTTQEYVAHKLYPTQIGHKEHDIAFLDGLMWSCCMLSKMPKCKIIHYNHALSTREGNHEQD